MSVCKLVNATLGFEDVNVSAELLKICMCAIICIVLQLCWPVKDVPIDSSLLLY